MFGYPSRREENRVGRERFAGRHIALESAVLPAMRSQVDPKRTRMPHVRKSSSMHAEISPSIIGHQAIAAVGEVDLCAQRMAIVANSTPTGPPPTIKCPAGTLPR